MLVRFFRWWLAELLALLPGTNRKPARQRLESLRVRRTHDGFEVLRLRGRSETLLASVPAAAVDDGASVPPLRRVRPGSTRVLFELSASNMLQKEITLPRAAQSNLHEVLGYEMERLTPFRVDEVVYDAQVLDPGNRDPLMHVMLRVLPRRIVEPIPALMQRFGFAMDPARIRIDPKGDDVTLTWLPPPVPQHGNRVFTAVLWAANAGLLAIAVAFPFHEQQRALDQLDAELRTARTAAAGVSALREQVETLQEELDYLASLKIESPPAVELIDEITRVLPDSTHLDRLQLKQGNVFMQGRSTRASALISLLEASPMLSDVRFRSPVTRAPGAGGEQFNITAHIVTQLSREEPIETGTKPTRTAAQP